MIQTHILVKSIGQEVTITPGSFSTHAIKVLTETTKNPENLANS